jgi:hypothetical protein
LRRPSSGAAPAARRSRVEATGLPSFGNCLGRVEAGLLGVRLTLGRAAAFPPSHTTLLLGRCPQASQCGRRARAKARRQPPPNQGERKRLSSGPRTGRWARVMFTSARCPGYCGNLLRNLIHAGRPSSRPPRSAPFAMSPPGFVLRPRRAQSCSASASSRTQRRRRNRAGRCARVASVTQRVVAYNVPLAGTQPALRIIGGIGEQLTCRDALRPDAR